MGQIKKTHPALLSTSFSPVILVFNAFCHSCVKNIDYRLLYVTETVLIKTLLFGNCPVDAHTNTETLNAISEDILTSKRFEEALFHS